MDPELAQQAAREGEKHIQPRSRERPQAPGPFKVVQEFPGSAIGEEELAAVSEVIRSGDIGRGAVVKQFAHEFTLFAEAPISIPLNGASCALGIAATVLDIGEGDEVITNPLAFLSTSIFAAKNGAKLVFADVDPDTYHPDEEQLEQLITPRTKAIFLASYDGFVPDMAKLADIAERHEISFVFDAARCLGGEFQGQGVASWAHMTAFSFGEEKTINTGVGGMLSLTKRVPLDKIKEAYSIGQWMVALPEGKKIENHYYMENIRASVGLAQLKKLPARNERVISIAERYTAALSELKGFHPQRVFPDRKHVYLYYLARLDPEEAGYTPRQLMAAVAQHQVELPTSNPIVYNNAAFRSRGYGHGLCPRAERLYREELVRLPLNGTMSDEDVDLVIKAVQESATQLGKK